MKFDFEVSPRSRLEIRNIVTRIRNEVDLDTELNFPIVKFFECGMTIFFPDFNYEYYPASKMGGLEGITIPEKQLIIINEKVIEDAVCDDGRARFTLAHEIGHYFLHRNEHLKFARCLNKNTPIYKSAEWQVNTFAAELLMPHFLIANLLPEEIRKKCHVSRTAAECQWEKINKKNQQNKLIA